MQDVGETEPAEAWLELSKTRKVQREKAAGREGRRKGHGELKLQGKDTEQVSKE